MFCTAFTLLDSLMLIFRCCSHDLRSSTAFSNLYLSSSLISITLVLYSGGRSITNTAIMSLSPMREGVACCDLYASIALIQLVRVRISFANALIDWPSKRREREGCTCNSMAMARRGCMLPHVPMLHTQIFISFDCEKTKKESKQDEKKW